MTTMAKKTRPVWCATTTTHIHTLRKRRCEKQVQEKLVSSSNRNTLYYFI